MTRSMYTIASLVVAGLIFLPAAYATHPHDAPGATPGGGMMGEGGMMGMGGMMAMMSQMNQMMESCSKMMGSADNHHGSGDPEEERKTEPPAIP